VCGRCREVVAVARAAADASEAITAAPPRKPAPNSWWKQWRLVWIPTAVVTAFSAASISVYIERSDRDRANVHIAEQNPTSNAAPPSAPAPEEQAKVEPPAPPTAAPPPVQPARHAHSTAAESPAPPPVIAARMPSEPEAPRAESTAPGAADRETRAAPPEYPAEEQPSPPQVAMDRPASTPQASNAPEAQEKQAQEQQSQQHHQAEVETSRMRSYKARQAPGEAQGGNAAPPASTTQTVSVSAAPQIETQPATSSAPAPMLGLKRTWNAATLSKPIQLPSGLAPVSITSGEHLLLALDKAGALFLSDDRGVTWEPITAQWTGRAVAVHRQAAPNSAGETAPATAQNGTAGAAPTAKGPAQPAVSFELSNDKNQMWVSTDGRTWTPK